ncbi:ABC transporter permease [Xanthomonas sp. A2111]|uniref:Transport permease protein n=1 Tax=Xanthomonas hawaiiensis TaxID=3003247 RepID=A0ABU2HZQ0_9XANT|nr:ABC transporter permease [Xanthomonas sp. A2111]MBO9828122.1 ABC transporter permease [Xanthomonas sp. A2111]MDS9991364.1 ABC transporter permease [Xanthomonas sp. A2111]
MKASRSLIALQALVRREIAHMFRMWVQTLVPPLTMMVLYVLIFGKLIGTRIGTVDGVSYLHFIAPGLVMMCIITNSYANASNAFYFIRFNRAIEELLVSPMHDWTILLGYVAAAVVRGLLVGGLVLLIALPMTALQVAHPFIVFLSALLAATIFSLVGVIVAIYAKNFYDTAHVSTYVLTPLSYLGGVFYPIGLLGEPWQSIARINPLMHMISAFRYGVLGADRAASVGTSLVVMLMFIIGLGAFALTLLGRGVGVRS